MLPDEAWFIVAKHCSTVYQLNRRTRDAVRRLTTELEVRYLHYPEQVHWYPNLSTLVVHSVDLRNHPLLDYLHAKVQTVNLMNVLPSASLLSGVPPSVTSLTINRRTPIHACERLNRSEVDYFNGHYCEYEEYARDGQDFIHKNMKHIDWPLLLELGELGESGGIELETVHAGIYDPSLPVSESIRHMRGDAPHELPPNLLSLDTFDWVGRLVNSLTSLRLVVCDYVPDLPPSLTDLRLTANVDKPTLERIMRCPIKHLGIGAFCPDALPLVPSTALVTLHASSTLYCCKLPKTLKHLVAHNLDPPLQFPELETLVVYNVTSALPPLPTSLRCLSLPYEGWNRNEQSRLRSFTNLHSFSLISHLPGDEYGLWKSEDFPPSLAALRLSLPPNQYVYSLPPNLRHLYLDLHGTVVPPPLPSTLLTLTIRYDDTQLITSAFMRCLPVGLRELELDQGEVEAQALGHLPPRLVRLDAYRVHGPNSWQDLPPTLAVLMDSCDGPNNLDNVEVEKHPALWHYFSHCIHP